MTAALKPCPFCGGEGRITAIDGDSVVNCLSHDRSTDPEKP